MSNFETMPELNANSTNDFFIIRQGAIDVKVKRATILNFMYPVGATWMNINPAITPTLQSFPGTWELLPEGCTLVTAALTDLDIGIVKGSNDVATPLKEHSHSAIMDNAGGHTHVISRGLIGYDRFVNPSNFPIGMISTPISNALSPEGNHSHTTILSSEGVTTPMLDVSGERYNLNVWKRTL